VNKSILALVLVAGQPFSCLRAESGQTFAVEAEFMELGLPDQAMWQAAERKPANNGQWLIAANKAKSSLPATYALDIPVGGTWYLWVRYVAHPVRSKVFMFVIQGNEQVFGEAPYGTTPEEKPETYGDKEVNSAGFIWTRRTLELTPGNVVVELHNAPERRSRELFQDRPIIGQSPQVDSFVLTNDPGFDPS